ncbi:AbrB/MazE/SpoVT family DNA-binding domain-containing protein [soil metagenome]
MTTKIQRWGNSQGIRLPKDVLQDARLAVGDAVHVSVVDGSIVLTRAQPARGRVSLAALVAAIPAGERAIEVDWGDAEGDEAW